MHGHLLGGFSVNLDVGTIIEIVDAIEALSISSPSDHLEIWDYSLTAIEYFCMRMNIIESKKVELGEAKEDIIILMKCF
ncbi:hypothetical protein H5410_003720 [Solanum commersonii]|uniref:Uncharacterized protein n=1 Tax=Solanum commersonii TaxID=4109 RepID=A0A9J6B5W1_SOLCO|nr:hypothetical protein H5410_003720 [Solanum commersonii]